MANREAILNEGRRFKESLPERIGFVTSYRSITTIPR